MNHDPQLFRQLFHAGMEQFILQLVVVVARDVISHTLHKVFHLVKRYVVLVPLGQVDGAVFGDAADPRAKFGGVLQGIQPLPGAEKGILYRILGGVGVLCYRVGNQQGSLAVANDQFLKGGLVPHQGQGDQGFVGLFLVVYG